MDRLDWIALLAATAIVSFVLFVPPAVGLADNGDFVKISGRFDLYLPDQANGFADTTYQISPEHHWTGDVLSSEILPAALAVALNRTFHSPSSFDMRWIGAVHAALYLFAFGLALPLMHGLPMVRRIILLVAIIVVLGDVMYLSALSSFYMDTAVWIFLCLAVVLYLRTLRRSSKFNRSLLLIVMALLITAKVQHILIGIGLFTLILVTHRALGFDREWIKRAIGTGAAALGLAYIGSPAGYSQIPAFNTIFYGLLPHSDNPTRDLKQLGLDESYARWIGTHSYSDDSPISDRHFSEAFQRRTGHFRIALFYARHPSQAWRILLDNLSEGGRQRAYLGNYDRRTGAREFQESNAFSLWSGLKKAAFWHHGVLYLAYIFGLVAAISVLAWKQRSPRSPGILSASMTFGVLVVLEPLVCSLADVLDNIRHEGLFNGLTDLAFVFVVALALHRRTSKAGTNSETLRHNAIPPAREHSPNA